MEPCTNCGSVNPHNGPCPRAHAGSVQQAQFEPSQITAGKVLQSRYEILHMLGQGGMGTVYMARDLRLKGRSCVVKKLRDDFYRDEDRQKAQEFFQREMEVLAELDPEQPNIVRLLDYFTENSDFFLVMDYVQGNNLHVMLHQERAGEPFTEETVLKWSQQICDVLIYLHSQTPPIIYRDLKPSNIMIDVKGSVKLVDFGIARRVQTGENTHVVSAGYSPPEQYWGSADVRSDIYSLGATMYFLLTGRDPEALHVCSPRAVNPDVSEGLDRLVQKCTSQDITERYQSATDLWEALLNTDREDPPPSTNSRIWEAVTGIVLLIVCGLIFFWQMPQGPDATNNPAKSNAQMMPPAEADKITDTRAPLEAETEQPAIAPASTEEGTAQNQADLAVQVMDEKDLTDPSGLIETKADSKKKPDAEPDKGLWNSLFGGK